MRAHRRLLLIALLVCSAVQAEDASSVTTDAILGSERVKTYVRISLTRTGEFRYELDGDAGQGERALRSPLLLAADGSPIDVRLTFVNPLLYAFETNRTESDDPSYLALKKFSESVGKLVTLVGGQTPNAPAVEGDTKGVAASVSGMNFLPQYRSKGLIRGKTEEIISEPFNSLELQSWQLWWNVTVAGVACRNENSDRLKRLMKALLKVDEVAYKNPPGRSKLVDPAAEFEASLAKARDSMSSATTMDGFEAAVNSARTGVGELGKKNEDFEQRLKPVEVYVKSEPPLCATSQAEFSSFHNSVMLKYLKETTEILETRKKAVQELAGLVSSAQKWLPPEGSPRRDDLLLTSIDVPYGKVQELEIVLSAIEGADSTDSPVQIKKGEPKRTIVRFARYDAVALEFALGAVYTSFTNPRFGTAQSNGTTVVADAGPEHLTFSVVASLNIVFRVRSFVHPFLQLGIGTGSGPPVLVVGAGVRFSNRLGISLGLLWSWKHELDKLHLGDPVSGTADIESDLHWVFETTPAFYAGLQYSP